MTEKQEKTTQVASETKVFTFNPSNQPIQVELFNQEPWFVAADVCGALRLGNVTESIRNLDDDEKLTSVVLRAGQKREVNLVNESGLYNLIFQSRKAEAKAFRKWVTAEVLPTIRKTGGYMVAAVDETPEQIMARAIKVADETLKRQQAMLQAKDEQIEAQEKEIRQLAPLADYTKEVLHGDGTYTFTQVAKSLGFRGVSQFTDWLNGKGVVFRESRSWLPYAKYATLEWFATRTTRYVKSDGTVGTNMYTVVTEKGRMGIRQLLSESQAKAMEGGAL